MAELVDALVSNTNEVTLVPVRLRLWVQKTPLEAILKGFLHFLANYWQTFQKIKIRWSGEIKYSSGILLQKPDLKRFIANSFWSRKVAE